MPSNIVPALSHPEILLQAILTTAEVTATLDPENARDNLRQVMRATISRRGETPPAADDGELIPMFAMVSAPEDKELVQRLSRGFAAAGDDATAQHLLSAFGEAEARRQEEEERRRREAEAARRREEEERRRQEAEAQRRQEAEARRRREAEARRRQEEEERRRRQEEARRRWRDKTFHYEVVKLDRNGNITSRDSASNQGYIEKFVVGTSVFQCEMANIPEGSFLMGSPETEEDRNSNESPQHSVNVPEFFISRTQVTQAQWRAVANLPKINRDLDPNPSNFKGDNRPVEKVDWYDCIEFCARLSQKTGKNYRLPSEAEWEYACRAGTTTPFHFGETISPEVAKYSSGSTIPVGSLKAANAWGLYDMYGNVWEWCLDDWHDSYNGAPNDGCPWINNDNDYHHSVYNQYQKALWQNSETYNDNHYKSPWQNWLKKILEHQNNKLLRGGLWNYYPRYGRSAFRFFNCSGFRNHNLGFRIAVSPART
jgi:formylglycine-generating enzyme required for sulfatase activity